MTALIAFSLAFLAGWIGHGWMNARSRSVTPRSGRRWPGSVTTCFRHSGGRHDPTNFANWGNYPGARVYPLGSLATTWRDQCTAWLRAGVLVCPHGSPVGDLASRAISPSEV